MIKDSYKQNKNNDGIRNIIDCVLVLLLIFFGYNYFTNINTKEQTNIEADIQIEEETNQQINSTNDIENRNSQIPDELFEITKK